jgi:hypothetical protein
VDLPLVLLVQLVPQGLRQICYFPFLVVYKISKNVGR